MEKFNHPHSQNSSSEKNSSEHLSHEKEKLDRAIRECQSKKTSKYIILNGKPYLITPDGVMSYEGTSTTTYSQSQKSGKE